MTNEIYDFNIHLTPNGEFEYDLDLTLFDPLAQIRSIRAQMGVAGVSGGNIMILDQSLIERPQEAENLVRQADKSGMSVTLVVDPRKGHYREKIALAASLGVRGIKFHPYFQNFADYDFPYAIGAANCAANHKMWVAVCCSYGTVRVYANSGVRLLIALVQAGVDTRLVALHSGGRQALDVMSVALEAENVILETSFSIPYWIGSSVENDIAFALKKVGARRCLYGSDTPYMPLKENIARTTEFLRKHGFCESEITTIMSGHALAQP